jgi:hypothetical protein
LSLGLASIASSRQVLRALCGDPHDADGDGVRDAQERVEQSAIDICDTDGDGYSDLEELARKSCLIDGTSIPLPASQALALTARGTADKIRVTMLIYYTQGELDEMGFGFGVVAREGRVFWLSSSTILATATASRHSASSGTGKIACVEFDLNPHLISTQKSIALFATLRLPGSGWVDAAAVVDLAQTRDGVFVKRSPIETSTYSSRGSAPGDGSLYQPIPVGGETPPEWGAGRLCFQRSVPVGYDSGVVLSRVVSADCQDGWDGYCSPSICASSVGEEYSSMDPAGLVGS